MKRGMLEVMGGFFLLGILLVPQVSWAAGGLVPCGQGDTACTLCDLIKGFYNLTTYLTGLLITIALAGLFFSGVMYIVSAGDDGMMKTAKEFAGACIKGFVIVLGAWLIVNVTMWVIGADISMAVGHGSWFEFNCDGFVL